MKRTFSVKAIWDDEAQVFYAQSDIEAYILRLPVLMNLKKSCWTRHLN